MKSLTIHLPDEVIERAERCAAQRGAELSNEVAEFVMHYAEQTAAEPSGNGQKATDADRARLFAALDAGRNVIPVGALTRNELYDRRVLH